MLNVKIGDSVEQNLGADKIIKIQSGDKIKVAIDEGSSYQVLIADNQAETEYYFIVKV